MHLVKPLQLIALVVGRNLMTVTQAIVIGVLLSTAPSTRVQGPSVFRKGTCDQLRRLNQNSIQFETSGDYGFENQVGTALKWRGSSTRADHQILGFQVGITSMLLDIIQPTSWSLELPLLVVFGPNCLKYMVPKQLYTWSPLNIHELLMSYHEMAVLGFN
jgi:hypothetical protein